MLGYIAFALGYSELRVVDKDLIHPLSLVFCLHSVWCIWTWKTVAGSLFAPYPIFLLAAIAFNGGQVILEAFRLNENGLLGGIFGPRTLVSTLVLVTIGLGTFHFGALCSAALSSRSVKRERPAAEWRDQSALRFVGWSLIAIALPAWWIESSAALSAVNSSGYLALYQGNADVGLAASSRLISELLVPGAILLLVGSKDRRLSLVVSIGLVGINTLLELFLGYRAYAVWPLLALAWAFHAVIRPLPKSIIAGGSAIILFVVFPLVRSIREQSGTERTSLDVLWDSYASIDSPAVSIISEMGGSMATVAYTLELIPSVASFESGLDYLYALATIVPNVFGGLHPAIERGTASTWLINIVDPWVAENGGSIGYSFIAEAYRNFGWVAGPAALFFIGFLMASFFLWASKSNDHLKLAAAAIFLSFLSHYARGEFYTLIRPLIWYTLMPCILVILVSNVSNQRTRFSSERNRPYRTVVNSPNAVATEGHRE